MDKVKVVILCGGAGTRLREQTEFMPKPLVQIGDKPILWHIMKIYAHYGFKDFVLCLGYKGEVIKQYFYEYKMLNCDFTINLGNGDIVIADPVHEDWNITLAQTGVDTMTASRVKKIEKYIDGSLFMLTYGDGLSNMNIKELLEFHRSQGKIGTVTGVHPSSRFGELVIENERVVDFLEKPQVQNGLVNGGFFVFDRRFFGYLPDDDSCVLEKEPLERLAADGELCVYKHTGFWACMDTQRDFQLLNNIWSSEAPPWKVW